MTPHWLGVFLLTAGCFESHTHEGIRPDAGRDSGSDAESMCAPPAAEARRFLELGCVPAVFDLPAREVALPAGPCPVVPTTTPFVVAGVWPGLETDRVRNACIRVVDADPRSGVRVGTLDRNLTLAFAVPFDAVDLAFEFIGTDDCGNLVRGRRRLQSEFEGPELLARDPERVTALPDESVGGLMYATERAVVALRGRIEAESPRDLVPFVREGIDAWVEGPDEGPSLRIAPHDPDMTSRLLPLQPGARLVRVPTPGDRYTSELLVLEPASVRILTIGLDDAEPRERRAFVVPNGATNPVVYDGALGIQVDDVIRVFDLGSGAERDASFLPGDRLIAARPGPYLVRGSSYDRLNDDTGLAAPTSFDGTLDPAIAAVIGPILALQPASPLLVFGEEGVAAIQQSWLEAFASPPPYDARSQLGGPIRVARTVWQFDTMVAVDTAEGSAIYRMVHNASGWSNPCDTWD